MTQHGYTGGFLTFFVRDAFTHGTYPAGNITWNHLWFLPCLLLMTVVLTPLFSLRDSGVLELAEGTTLTDRIAEGPIPMDDAGAGRGTEGARAG